MNGDITAPKTPKPEIEPVPDKELELSTEAANDPLPETLNIDEDAIPDTEKEPVLADAPVMPVPGVTAKPKPAKKPKMSKKKKLLVVIITLLLLGGGGFAGWWFGFKDSGQPKAVTNQNIIEERIVGAEPASVLVASPLSGAYVSASDAARPVTGIMIENSGEARPQSGLREADVIFEAIAEGGITRFLALFQSKQPDYIGPVRSARPYYVEWAAAFDASYAHAGGSPDGIARISQLGVKDINAFAYGTSVFYRTDDRSSPHNLYSTFVGLDKVNSDKGYTTSTFTPWSRKDDVVQSPLANKIDAVISSSFYNAHYDYDATTNTYARSVGGSKHLDEKSGKQLSPNVVLVMVMNNHISGQYNVYTTTGSGAFVAFQDGVAGEGTWNRAGAKDQYIFKDKYGFDFLFNRGQTWVSIVDARSDVSYVP